MILRVYAMWSQSKRILYTLLFVYVSQIIVSFVGRGIYSPSIHLSGMSQAKLRAKLESHEWPCRLPPFSPVTVVQVMDFSFCSILRDTPSSLLLGTTALRSGFSVMLFILAVIPTLKESLVLYRATKRWQPNRYMQQLVKDGFFYFLAYVSHLPFFRFRVHSLPLHSPAHLTLKYLPKNLTILNF